MEDRDIAIVLVIILVALLLIWLNRRRSSTCYQVANNDEQIVTTELKPSNVKSETLPVFLRHDNRPIVLAPKVTSRIELPRNFDARVQWPSWITPVLDQGSCGSCWAFSSTGVFGDRIKIATNASSLVASDIISPYQLAACMKCGSNNINKVCNSVCSGNYMDDVLAYIRSTGAYSQNQINIGSNNANGRQYICFQPSSNLASTIVPYKASSSYRANPYAMTQLSTAQRLSDNEYAIMYDIFRYGPVTATIKIFDPVAKGQTHKNFYLYKNGIYGTDWGTKDPSDSDGYHAVAIIGWGEEVVGKQTVKFWWVRNSWGADWGINGYAKVVRGVNRIIIESDIWSMTY